MRIEVVTSLYPSPQRPFEGIFAERRWSGMAARGHEVHVTCPLPFAPPAFLPRVPAAWRELARMPRREERQGVVVERPRYVHLPAAAPANARRFARRALRALERREPPEVVVLDYAWPAAALVAPLRQAGLAVLVNGRGSDILQVAGEPGLRPLLAAALGAADGLCAVSQDLLEAMEELAGRPGAARLIPNGVDLERFRPADKLAARRELGLAQEGAWVLVCGHLIERKDPLLALAVVHALGPAGPACAVIGRGPLQPELEGFIATHELAERVRLVGEVDPETLARWYAACDVLLLTSRREGRPNVVLEALASGRPVLATEAGGTAELLTVEPERMLARERSPERLAAMLSSLLASPPAPDDLRASVARLSWDASFEALEELLREVSRVPA